MTPKPILEQRLADAEAALHKLVTQSLPVQVLKDGRQVTFAPSNESSLRAYIAELKDQISGRTGRARARMFIPSGR